ncbi:MAG: hypothetical protein Q4G61_02495 [Tissierellia bacterium]|nr:hypothetical protein [Tissierellia bacterium]
MNYSTFGWLSAGLLALLVLPFVFLRLNKLLFQSKDKRFFSLVKALRSIHKPAGILLIASAFYHGYLAMGTIRLHTGTVLYVTAALTVLLGAIFYNSKNRRALSLHKFFAAIAILMLAVHLFAPSLFTGIS